MTCSRLDVDDDRARCSARSDEECPKEKDVRNIEPLGWYMKTVYFRRREK